MRISREKTIPIILAALVFFCAGALRASVPATGDKLAQYVKSFDYDHNMPLNAEVKPLGAIGASQRYHVLFDSLNGERVPGEIYIPTKGKAPYPCIVVQHGYGQDKSFAALFANAFAPRGYAVMAIDMEYHGERKEPGKDVLTLDPEANTKALAQSVVDISRSVDYLASRGDIDMNRIGYIGVSLGSFLGSIYNGIDKRTKTAVFVVGGGDWDVMVRQSQVGPFIEVRKALGTDEAKLSDFAARMNRVDPLNYSGLISPRPLLMISCENDKLVPKKGGEELFAAAGEPKEIKWFTCGGDVAHVPPIDKTTVLAKSWFDKYLK